MRVFTVQIPLLRYLQQDHFKCMVLYNDDKKVNHSLCADINQYISLKGQGHVTVNKPVISIIYIVAHTWPLCSAQILVDGANPLESYFQKSTSISAIVQQMSVSFVSLQSSRVHLQNNTFILSKIIDNLCNMAYQNTAKLSFPRTLFTLCDPTPLKFG